MKFFAKKIIDKKLIIIITYFAQCDHTFLWSHAATFDHNEVIVHFTIVRETAHRSDGFFSKIVLRRSIVLHNLKKYRVFAYNFLYKEKDMINVTCLGDLKCRNRRL